MLFLFFRHNPYSAALKKRLWFSYNWWHYMTELLLWYFQAFFWDANGLYPIITLSFLFSYANIYLRIRVILLSNHGKLWIFLPKSLKLINKVLLGGSCSFSIKTAQKFWHFIILQLVNLTRFLFKWAILRSKSGCIEDFCAELWLVDRHPLKLLQDWRVLHGLTYPNCFVIIIIYALKRIFIESF